MRFPWGKSWTVAGQYIIARWAMVGHDGGQIFSIGLTFEDESRDHKIFTLSCRKV